MNEIKPRLGFRVCKHCGKDENEVMFYKNRNTVCSECTKIDSFERYRSKQKEQPGGSGPSISIPSIIMEENVHNLQVKVHSLSSQIEGLNTVISEQNNDIKFFMSKLEKLSNLVDQQKEEINQLRNKFVDFRPDSPINITTPKIEILTPEPILLPPPKIKQGNVAKANDLISKTSKDLYTKAELESLAKQYHITLSTDARRSKEGTRIVVLEWFEKNKEKIY